MIVYVESNFVLELAFLRDEHESCEALIELATARDIDLVLPAFSIGEPYNAWHRRWQQRRELHDRLRRELNELARSAPYREASRELQAATRLLIQSGDEEKRRLDGALERILDVAQVIPLSADVIRGAIASQATLGLKPQDSIVYASVYEHLAAAGPGRKCFVTRDAKDFLNPDIKNELDRRDCRLLARFGDALGYVRSPA